MAAGRVPHLREGGGVVEEEEPLELRGVASSTEGGVMPREERAAAPAAATWLHSKFRGPAKGRRRFGGGHVLSNLLLPGAHLSAT